MRKIIRGLLNFTLLLEILVALRPLSEPWPPVLSSSIQPHVSPLHAICVTELFLILLPFVFPSIPRPSGEPSSSDSLFQNLFLDSAVQGAVKLHLSGRWLSGSPNIGLAWSFG
jgi:hypothetical protein